MTSPRPRLMLILAVLSVLMLAQCSRPVTTPPISPEPIDEPDAPTAVPATAIPEDDPTELPNQSGRALLSYEDLTEGFDYDSPLDENALTPPEDAADPEHVFEGRLELHGEATDGSFNDIQNFYSDLPERKSIPEFDFAFVQSGGYLLPVQRGLIITHHPFWNLIIEPGRVWQEDGDHGFSRASFPFTITPKGGNATFNGTMTFLFDDENISKVWYQITQETATYGQADFWGLLDATYHAESMADADAIKAAYEQELANRFPTKSIDALTDDYPGVDVSQFGRGISPEHMTWYGVVVDGVNYLGGCETRYGIYPYCESMRAASYSTAKTGFVAVALMRLTQKYGPEVPDLLVKDYLPETADSPGDWETVTFEDVLDMATGNYSTIRDEDSEEMGAYFGAQGYENRIARALDWPNATEPGEVWVYRTADTFILVNAMQNYLQSQEGEGADIFNFVVDEVFVPIGIGPGGHTTMRTSDDDWQGRPEGGYGLWWVPDDIVKLSVLLNNDAGAVNGEQLLDPAMLAASLQQDPDDRGLPASPLNLGNDGYNNSFWMDRYTDNEGFDCTIYVPEMRGVTGNMVLLLPNGVTYYYFSDNYEFTWRRAIQEADKLSPYCS